MRQLAVRLDDAGMHNVLYSRENNVVTLLDFESAQDVKSNSTIPSDYDGRWEISLVAAGTSLGWLV